MKYGLIKPGLSYICVEFVHLKPSIRKNDISINSKLMRIFNKMRFRKNQLLKDKVKDKHLICYKITLRAL